MVSRPEPNRQREHLDGTSILHSATQRYSLSPSGKTNKKHFCVIRLYVTVCINPVRLPGSSGVPLFELLSLVLVCFHSEENVWKLCEFVREEGTAPLEYLYVIFISNEMRMVRRAQRRT